MPQEAAIAKHMYSLCCLLVSVYNEKRRLNPSSTSGWQPGSYCKLKVALLGLTNQ